MQAYLAVDKKGASVQLVCCLHAWGQGSVSSAVHHTHLEDSRRKEKMEHTPGPEYM